ncbi:MAG: hypothetical protein AAF985_06060 [Bacteroidota bacterium]
MEIIDKDASSFALIFTGGIMLFIVISSSFRAKQDVEKLKARSKRKPTQEELEERKKWAGHLEIKEQYLVFNYREDQQIKVEIKAIKAIGELTTDADPIAIDWYLIIVKRDNEVIYFPAYAAGLQETLKQLSAILNHEIVPKLFASIKFDSNVIYPKSVDGQKLFQLEGLNPSGTWKKVKVGLGLTPITPILRNEIMELKE